MTDIFFNSTRGAGRYAALHQTENSDKIACNNIVKTMSAEPSSNTLMEHDSNKLKAPQSKTLLDNNKDKKVNFPKSSAQVARSVAPHVAHVVAPRTSAGQSPIPHDRKKQSTHGLRLRAGEIDLIRTKASELQMSVNAYIRAKALGEDYIERPPEWLRDVLLKLYVEMSRQGNNLNQIARSVNREQVSAEMALSMADRQRVPMFKLMEKVELALSGRRPPDDY